MLSVGASPDDVARLTAILRAVERFGSRLAGICGECAQALEELASPDMTEDPEDTAAQQRADDDGWRPAD